MKKRNIIVTLICSFIAAAGFVGVIAGLSNGFTKDIDDWFETRDNLRVFNLQTSDISTALGNTTLVDFLNNGELKGSNNGTVVKSASYVNYCYKSFGLKLGYVETLGGSFNVDFVDEFSFNRCLICARNFYDISYIDEENGINTPEYGSDGTMIVQKYISDNASISVNNSLEQKLITNEKNEKEYPKESKLTFSFENLQKNLEVFSVNGRSIISSIELWTED